MKLASRLLVPGDLLELKIGDIVPADAVLLPGVPLQVDQSALTGESLPVTISAGGKVKMGSAIKRGECKAVVCATGALRGAAPALGFPATPYRCHMFPTGDFFPQVGSHSLGRQRSC